jgi:RNA polymerase sigma-70 factor, ECF subfamily
VTAAGPVSLDRPTLERLYQQLERPLYNVVYRWLWDREEARELVQETFVRLWRMRTRVAVDTVQPLAYRVALNLAANRRRWRRLRRLVTLDALRTRAGYSRGADEDLDEAQRRVALHAAVDGLPERLRQVIVLCELGEMSYAEVATVLQIPPGTVASRRNAALSQLRQALGNSSAPATRSQHVVR